MKMLNSIQSFIRRKFTKDRHITIWLADYQICCPDDMKTLDEVIETLEKVVKYWKDKQ